MRFISMLVLAALILPGETFTQDGTAQSDRPLGCWEELPLPAEKKPHISAIGMEPGGVLWLMTRKGLYYWNGMQFTLPVNIRLKAGQYQTSLYGGMDRGLYATQPGQDHKGKLYELSDGRALHVTDYYYETNHSSPGLYVSKTGMICNWGARFLSAYIDEEWKQVEASLSGQDTLVFDTGDRVFFYYNGALASVDAEGRFEKRQIPLPLENKLGSRRIQGVLWGSDRMMLLSYGSNAIHAFNLHSGKQLDIHLINEKLHPPDSESGQGIMTMHDLFRVKNGSCWVFVYEPENRSDVFKSVSATGEVEIVEASRRLGWNNSRCWQHPRSVLNASDDTIWFGLPGEGIARYADGRFDRLGWKQGVLIGNCRYLLEGLLGKVFAASYKKIYQYQPDRPPTPDPAWMDLWREYTLAASHPLRDSEGRIWMFLEDHPGEISCWTGQQWNHVTVPFDLTRARLDLADDRGRIYLSMSEKYMGAYEIGSGFVKQHEDFDSMLVAAVQEGVKRFFCRDISQACIVLDNGEIWHGHRNQHSVRHYDGEKWNYRELNQSINSIHESTRFGIMLRGSDYKFYTWDQDHFSEIPRSLGRARRWLLGPRSLQPFEYDLMKRWPEEYFPVEEDNDGVLHLMVPREETGIAPLRDPGEDKKAVPVFRKGDPLPFKVITSPSQNSFTTGYHGGFWSENSKGSVLRILGGRTFACDFSNTPLYGHQLEINRILEDLDTNLWIDVLGHRGEKHRVFFKRPHDTHLMAGELHTTVRRRMELPLQVILPGIESTPERPLGDRVFWRFKNGNWRGSSREESIFIYFPHAGRFELEVVAIDPIGGLPQKGIQYLVDASDVLFPDTKITKEGPYSTHDVIWEIPADTMPSMPGRVPRLVYSINGGKWQPAYRDKCVLIDRLLPGEYRVAVAALEEEVYYDPSPLEFALMYTPDYRMIVETRIPSLMSRDPRVADAAMLELKAAGKRITPILKEKVKEIEEAYRLGSRLYALIGQINR